MIEIGPNLKYFVERIIELVILWWIFKDDDDKKEDGDKK
jgi:hypothetical protein